MGLFDKINEPEETAVDDKNRLFETHKEVSGSSRKYIKVLGVMTVIVIVIGVAISYLTLPKVGDLVRGPKGLEEAIRTHFLDKEKRTSTDITFYYCESYYWARVGVEKRPDITTNPVYSLASYKARATAAGENKWTITATPITTPEMDVPCR